MKGKISTKALVITILTVVLLAVAATGTVLFLKDNGEAAAKTQDEEQNTEATLPVTGDETENEQTENGQEQATTPEVNSNGEETVENTTVDTTQTNAQTTTVSSNTTPTQTTTTMPADGPAESTVEIERVASETTTLGWNSITVANDDADFNRNINYTTYTVTYTPGEQGAFKEQIINDLVYGDETPTFKGETTANLGYTFAGWNPVVAATVNGDATYTATWKDDKNNNGIADEDEYRTITYTDGVANEEVFADVVYTNALDGLATPAFKEDGSNPTRTDYVFAGWNPAVAATVNGDATYTATWKDDKNNNGEPDENETYSYIVEYYYDNIKDESETTGGSALVGTTISTYIDKNIPGYRLEKDVEPIVIKKNENVLKVYYVKDSYTYKIEYYKDSLDTEKIATIGGTDSYKKEYKTQLTNEIVTADAGQNWINEFKPEGYSDGEVTYTTIEIEYNNNIVKVLYTPRTDLSYTVKYFYNGIEDPKLEDTIKGQTYGTLVENVTDKTSEKGGGWSLDHTDTLPLTVGIGSVIKVYYTKAEITVEKTRTPQGIVEPGDTITYTITATNHGGKEGTVKIADSAPTGTNFAGNIVTTGYQGTTTPNESLLAQGIELVVPANDGKAKVSFDVTVTGNVNTTITNVPTVNGFLDDNNKVSNDVEKTVTTTAKTETIKGTNIVLVIDTSGSMDEKTSDNDSGVLIARCEDPNCAKTHRTNWAPFVGNYKYHTKMTTAIDAACRFIDQVYPNSSTDNGTTITVIEFNSDAKTVGSTASSYASAQALKNQIKELDSNGNTAMGKALELANSTLTGLSQNADYKDNDNVVVFLSDGDPTDGNAYVAAANALKTGSNKAVIYTIGFEVESSAASVLRSIASNGQYYGSDMNGLFDTFDLISSKIGKATRQKQTENGLLELTDIYADSAHPITIKVNGTVQQSITSLPIDDLGKVILKDGKYYLDLTKFAASDNVEIEYFSN